MARFRSYSTFKNPEQFRQRLSDLRSAVSSMGDRIASASPKFRQMRDIARNFRSAARRSSR